IGQLPPGAITLMESVDEVRAFVPRDPKSLAYVTQTTLSVDDTAEIVGGLKARFPDIHGPHKEDICYATTNRQEVVKKVAPMVEPTVGVGSPNSSNPQRLREVAERAGCPRAALGSGPRTSIGPCSARLRASASPPARPHRKCSSKR